MNIITIIIIEIKVTKSMENGTFLDVCVCSSSALGISALVDCPQEVYIKCSTVKNKNIKWPSG